MNSLKALTDSQLIDRVEILVRREKQIVQSLIWHLQEVEDRKLYIQIGYTSLFECLVKHFKYSEAVAYSRISVLRIIRSVPDAKVALQNGEVSISTLSLAQSFIQKQEKESGERLPEEVKANYLSAIKHKSTQETKQVLAAISPVQELPVDKVNHLNDSKIQLQITVDQELLAKFDKLKNLISHENINPTYNELLNLALDAVIESKEKSKGLHVRNRKQSPPLTQGFADKKTKAIKSRYISRPVKRMVLERSKSECEFVHPDGQKCASKFQLQFDHIKAFSRGGDSSINNIQTLCRVHNAWKGSGDY